MTRNDKTYFFDMLLAARSVMQFTKGMTKEDFLSSRLHQSAVIRELQVIGEAARLVSEEAKATYPQVDWANIAGMRNRLIHEYFRVSRPIVWQVASEEMVLLIAQLETIIGETKDNE